MKQRLTFAMDELFGADKSSPEERPVRGLSTVKQTFGMSDHLFKHWRVGFGDQGFGKYRSHGYIQSHHVGYFSTGHTGSIHYQVSFKNLFIG